ncbi:hypothetical protein V6N13_047789 [Hibiscus sabdariffa]
MAVAPALPAVLLSLIGISLWVAEAEVHHYNFIVAEKNFTRLCKSKSMLVVNGRFPGPAIYVHKGEQILIFGTWFTYDVNKVIREILRTGKDVPISDAYIINGQPGDFCACSKEKTFRWRVDYGKTKRLKSLVSKEHPIDVPRNVTTRMYITASMDRINHADMDYTLLSSLNNISWVNPSTDVLQAYYRHLSGFYTSDFPDEPPYYFDFVADLRDTGTHPLKGTKVKILEYGEEVEIVFQSTNLLNASDEHSMYIHGHKFYILGEGYGNFNSTTDPETYNLVDPPYLSTASLPVKGWLTIRFKANNPGVWAMHCQEGRHLIWGMSTVLIVKNGNNPETSIRSPPPNMPSC